MEKAEISRLINSFNAIKGYFDTTKKYMPQIAKLVFFIEEVIPLLNTIQKDLHQSSQIIPTATEKLDKVTSATEMATTEVMDIVDNVISRLNNMSTSLEELENQIESEKSLLNSVKEKTDKIRQEIDGSQDDLFSIMNALQFQDITTQQINSIAQVIDSVQVKLGDLLHGFDDDGFNLPKQRVAAFDENAEFDFSRSAESQKLADEFIKQVIEKNKAVESKDSITEEQGSEENQESGECQDIVFGEDGQPDINAILSQLNAEGNNTKDQ
ncbi:MAG: protein phosphatase CheZ [Candidatus Latescibacteria bacterium]|nr:protein phosphatase CheZ [Candidatus Latescibacterota bacterium]